MLRPSGVLFVLVAALAAGCSIDRIEWESTGFPVEEVRHTLEEEHHVANPVVECIKREVGGALWECRAHAGEAEFECEVKVGVREAIRSLECEEKHEEQEAEPEHTDAPSAKNKGQAPGAGREDQAAETEPAAQKENDTAEE